MASREKTESAPNTDSETSSSTSTDSSYSTITSANGGPFYLRMRYLALLLVIFGSWGVSSSLNILRPLFEWSVGYSQQLLPALTPMQAHLASSLVMSIVTIFFAVISYQLSKKDPETSAARTAKLDDDDDKDEEVNDSEEISDNNTAKNLFKNFIVDPLFALSALLLVAQFSTVNALVVLGRIGLCVAMFTFYSKGIKTDTSKAEEKAADSNQGMLWSIILGVVFMNAVANGFVNQMISNPGSIGIAFNIMTILTILAGFWMSYSATRMTSAIQLHDVIDDYKNGEKSATEYIAIIFALIGAIALNAPVAVAAFGIWNGSTGIAMNLLAVTVGILWVLAVITTLGLFIGPFLEMIGQSTGKQATKSTTGLFMPVEPKKIHPMITNSVVSPVAIITTAAFTLTVAGSVYEAAKVLAPQMTLRQFSNYYWALWLMSFIFTLSFVSEQLGNAPDRLKGLLCEDMVNRLIGGPAAEEQIALRDAQITAEEAAISKCKHRTRSDSEEMTAEERKAAEEAIARRNKRDAQARATSTSN